VVNSASLIHTLNQLRHWARQGGLSPAALEYAFIGLNVVPDRAGWCQLLPQMLWRVVVLLAVGMGYVWLWQHDWELGLLWQGMSGAALLILLMSITRGAPRVIEPEMILQSLDAAGYDTPDLTRVTSLTTRAPSGAQRVWSLLGGGIALGLVYGVIKLLVYDDISLQMALAGGASVMILLGWLLLTPQLGWRRGFATLVALGGGLFAALAVERYFYPNASRSLLAAAVLLWALFVLFRDRLLRLLFSGVAALVMVAALHHLQWSLIATALSAMVCVWIWQNESTWSVLDLYDGLRPLGYASALSCVCAPGLYRLSYGVYWFAPEPWPWDAIILGGALLINTAINVRRCLLPKLSLGTVLPLMVMLLLVLLLWRVPGLLAALLVLSLALRRGNGGLRLLGCAALVCYGYWAIEDYWDWPWLNTSLGFACVLLLLLAWDIRRRSGALDSRR
jgi:hypothetical protein